MAKQARELRQQPLIAIPELARCHDVGTTSILTAARAAGIEPEQRLNGRYLLSFAQAEAVAAELNKSHRSC